MSSSQDFISSWLPLVRTRICQEAARHVQSRCDKDGTWWNFTQSSSPIHWGPAPPPQCFSNIWIFCPQCCSFREITKITHPKNLRDYNVWTSKSMQDLSSPYWMQQIFFIDSSFPSDLKNATHLSRIVHHRTLHPSAKSHFETPTNSRFKCTKVNLPSRELTHPTPWEKDNHLQQCFGKGICCFPGE